MATLTIAQALQDAAQAGFTGNALTTIVAIAMAESGLNTDATNTAGNSPPSTDRGIVQINSYWHSEVSDACAFDPLCAFQQAYRISSNGTTFAPWSTYTGGRYQQFMAQVQAAQGGATPVSTVNWQQPGFETMPETDGHGDTCGPIAIADYLHVAQGLPLSIATIDQMRSDLIGWGLMNVPGEVGMTLQQINSALRTHYGVQPVKFVDFNSALDLATFHQDIITASLNKQYILVEVAAAWALPNGQAGVDYHFIGLWGINSTLGYATANGDTYAALASKVPVSTVWYSIGQLEAGQPCGYIILPAVGADEVGVPAGWSDDGTTLKDPNGKEIVLGFRQFVLGYPGGWESDNLPLTASDENDLNPLEIANPSIGTGNRRVFRYRALGWSPSFNGGQVYMMWMGEDLLATEAKVRDLEAQLAAVPPPAPPPPPPAPKPNYDSEVAAVQSALDALDAAMKAQGEA